MFLQAFLGALLALVVFAAAKWTLLYPITNWRLRRAGRGGEGIALGVADFEKMHADFKQQREAEMAAERKALAVEIARELRQGQ